MKLDSRHIAAFVGLAAIFLLGVLFKNVPLAAIIATCLGWIVTSFFQERLALESRRAQLHNEARIAIQATTKDLSDCLLELERVAPFSAEPIGDNMNCQQEINNLRRKFLKAAMDWNNCNVRYLPVVPYVNPAMNKLSDMTMYHHKKSGGIHRDRVEKWERNNFILYDLLNQYDKAISYRIIKLIDPEINEPDPLAEHEMENGNSLILNGEGDFDLELEESFIPEEEGN